jgi:hypothetical protein
MTGASVDASLALLCLIAGGAYWLERLRPPLSMGPPAGASR